MSHQQTEWERVVAPGSPIVICGAGNLCRQFLEQYPALLEKEGELSIQALCDNDASKHGTYEPRYKIPIISPADASDKYGGVAFFVIMIHLGAEDMREQLESIGVPPDRIIHWWNAWLHFDVLRMPAWADVPPHPENWLDVWADEASRDVVRDAYAFFKTYTDRTAAFQPREAYSLPDNIYFDPAIYKSKADERFLDCGAFNGDTMLEYRKRYDMYQADIFCVEADPDNFKALSLTQSRLVPEGTREWCALVGDDSIESVLFSGSGVSAKIDDHGVCVPARTIDSLCKYWLTSLIKLDIEGAELDTLRGAAKTIKRDRPVIACCLYHHPRDLWEIPAFLRGVCEDYRFYARCYENMGWETVCYAVPVERCVC